MERNIDKRTGRPTRELAKLHRVEAKGSDGKDHLFVGDLYTREGPASGAGRLAWTLAGAGYEKIDLPPKTDMIVEFSDGDFARIRLDNPEDIRGKTYAERLANQDELRWSLTNVGMQVDGEGIRLPKDTILSMKLEIGKPLTLASGKWPKALQTPGNIKSVFVYDRTEQVDEGVAKTKPETSILEDFRAAVKKKAAEQAIKGSGIKRPY